VTSKISATAVTAHSRRNQLHRKYQNGQKGKSPTRLECAAYTPNYWWLDYIPDDGVHRFLLLLLKHRWKHTGQTLIENPKITETWFPLSFREITETNGWTREQYLLRKQKALNWGLINIRNGQGGRAVVPYFQINERTIEKWVKTNIKTMNLDEYPLNGNLRENPKVTTLNVDSTVRQNLRENPKVFGEEEAPMKRGSAKKLTRTDKPISRTNIYKPLKSKPNKKIVIQSLSDTNVSDKENITYTPSGDFPKTLNLIKNDYSFQINRIIVEWGKLENGVSHEVGTQVYTRASKLINNLLQGKHISQRKDGKPPIPLQNFYQECIIPQEVQTHQWTPGEITAVLKTLSEELDHSFPLDTVLWNPMKQYSRFLTTAAHIYQEQNPDIFTALASRLIEQPGWNKNTVGAIALGLRNLYQSGGEENTQALKTFTLTVEWWLENNSKPYIPQAFSVREFTNKWLNIESARKREIQITHRQKNPDLSRNWKDNSSTFLHESEEDTWKRMKAIEARGGLDVMKGDVSNYTCYGYYWHWDKSAQQFCRKPVEAGADVPYEHVALENTLEEVNHG